MTKNILTLAAEFKELRCAIVQLRVVVLIALFALVRRFIILSQPSPSIIAALAGASLARGVMFWIIGSKEEPQEEEAGE